MVGFGDPGPALGRLVSITSNCHAMRRPPEVSARRGLRIALGIVAGLIGLLVCQIVFRSIVVGMSVKDLRAYRGTLDALHLLVYVGSAGVAAGVYYLSRLVLQKTLVGPTFDCTMIGTDGMAIFTRSPTADSGQVVPFADVAVLVQEQRETTVLKDQFGNRPGASTERTYTATWRHEGGQLLYGYHWRGTMGREPQAHFGFLEAATKAQRAYRVRAKLPLLDGPGVRIGLEGTPGFVHVGRGRVDVSLPNLQFSAAPSEIAGASVQNGELTLRFARDPITLAASQLPDLHLLLAALSQIGVRVG
jgi:hypothetical protein